MLGAAWVPQTDLDCVIIFALDLRLYSCYTNARLKVTRVRSMLRFVLLSPPFCECRSIIILLVLTVCQCLM